MRFSNIEDTHQEVCSKRVNNLFIGNTKVFSSLYWIELEITNCTAIPVKLLDTRLVTHRGSRRHISYFIVGVWKQRCSNFNNSYCINAILYFLCINLKPPSSHLWPPPPLQWPPPSQPRTKPPQGDSAPLGRIRCTGVKRRKSKGKWRVEAKE